MNMTTAGYILYKLGRPPLMEPLSMHLRNSDVGVAIYIYIYIIPNLRNYWSICVCRFDLAQMYHFLHFTKFVVNKIFAVSARPIHDQIGHKEFLFLSQLYLIWMISDDEVMKYFLFFLTWMEVWSSTDKFRSGSQTTFLRYGSEKVTMFLFHLFP